MGAYICAICDNMFDSHEVGCWEHNETELICDDCHQKKEIEDVK